MRLHQLKVDYDAEQDRLLMLVATTEEIELRLSLTRRFVKLLWPLLVKLAEEASPRIRTQANPEARKVLADGGLARPHGPDQENIRSARRHGARSIAEMKRPPAS